jgi:hypothetical protein
MGNHDAPANATRYVKRATGRDGTTLQPVLHLWHHNRPIQQQNDKEHLSHRPLDRVRKANEPEWNRLRPKFLSLQRADLNTIKGRHKISSNFSRFLFGYGIGRILFTGLKDVFQRAAVLGCASVPETVQPTWL